MTKKDRVRIDLEGLLEPETLRGHMVAPFSFSSEDRAELARTLDEPTIATLEGVVEFWRDAGRDGTATIGGARELLTCIATMSSALADAIDRAPIQVEGHLRKIGHGWLGGPDDVFRFAAQLKNLSSGANQVAGSLPSQSQKQQTARRLVAMVSDALKVSGITPSAAETSVFVDVCTVVFRAADEAGGPTHAIRAFLQDRRPK
jgi:hypothetical protein